MDVNHESLAHALYLSCHSTHNSFELNFEKTTSSALFIFLLIFAINNQHNYNLHALT